MSFRTLIAALAIATLVTALFFLNQFARYFLTALIAFVSLIVFYKRSIRTMTNRRIIATAAAAAIVAEGAFIWVFNHAGHEIGFFWLFHFVSFAIAFMISPPSTVFFICLACNGAVQFFVIFWLGMIIWRHHFERHDANPS
jgi:hypothetical protein